MSMFAIEMNQQCRPDIQVVGDERTPVIVLDDPIQSVDDLQQYAYRQAVFDIDSEFAYPGIRAPLPTEYAELLVPQLAGLLAHVYDVPRSFDYRLIHHVFSLITTRPQDLDPLQRIPHTDSRLPYYFATVHYLNSGEHAGTGFFRHRPTGFERISEQRYPQLVQAGNAHMQAHGLPAEKYINSSDDHFELIAEVEHRPNRLVMYPGNLLHSGLIQPDRDISTDPSEGRLTANLFLYFDQRGTR